MLTLKSALYSRKQRLTGQPPHTSTARRTATGKHDHGTEDSHWRARAQVFRGAPITNPRQREVYIPETLNKLTLRGIYLTPPCRVILHPVTVCVYIYIHTHSAAGKFVNSLKCSIYLHKYDPKHNHIESRLCNLFIQVINYYIDISVSGKCM